jgi:tetratricopeptide (TPR) repeat protein
MAQETRRREMMSDLTRLYDEADKLKEAGDYDDAVQRLSELLEQNDQYALAHSALAVLYGKLGDHERAVQHAQKVCELEPEDPFSFTALSVTYQRAFAGTQNRQYIQLAEDAMARSRMMGSVTR